MRTGFPDLRRTERVAMHDLIEDYRARTAGNADIKASTAKARMGALKRILKTWPGFRNLDPLKITPEVVFDWAARFKTEGTNFRPPGAKAPRRGNSASSVNSAIDVLRALFELAIERGLLRVNPLTVRRSCIGGRLKKRFARRPLILPTRTQLEALFAAMERNGSIGGGGAEAADFCRFLLMSGARVGEAPLLTWGLIDWERGLIHLPGYKTETSARTVPLFHELRDLLRKVQERRRSAARFRALGGSLLAPADAVFRIKECQKTIDSACCRARVPRITHHGFRHLFATACIESGVDVPTVSRWLGHADGGVLAMKTYGHLRPDHSRTAASKVSFGMMC